MEIHKAFEEAILRAKDHPSLTSENQAQLLALHQQATTGGITGPDAGAHYPDDQGAGEQYRGLSPDEAKQQYITYVAELTKRRAES